jgi:NitT/TauT family transport system ATP-binding protein
MEDATLCAPPEERPIIDLRAVSHSFFRGQRGVKAIDDVNLQVAAGCFATVVGPSGCGKSTLLMIVAGLLKPTSGEIWVADQRIMGPRPDQIGMVFQEATLLPWKTALGNIEFPLVLSHTDRSRRVERSRTLLDLVGLEEFAGHFPHELSGGMRQRIGIARGLAHDPRILLMDEPFSALDEQSRTNLGHELLRIWEKTKKTVLFITHSLSEAVYLSDTVFVMSRSPGRILEIIKIEIPRPRPIEVMGSAEFGEYRNRIWKWLSEAQQ